LFYHSIPSTFFFLCFCPFPYFVYLLFQTGTKEMNWCTLSLVLCPPNHLRMGKKEIHVNNQLVVHDGINQARPRIKQHTKIANMWHRCLQFVASTSTMFHL
jgi:hypothetical protein